MIRETRVFAVALQVVGDNGLKRLDVAVLARNFDEALTLARSEWPSGRLISCLLLSYDAVVVE